MNGTILMRYLKEHEGNINSKMAAYVAELETMSEVNPQAAASIVNELKNQRSRLKLIASENYSSLATQLSMGNLLTDKYSEGYPKHRYYAGCKNCGAYSSENLCWIPKRKMNTMMTKTRRTNDSITRSNARHMQEM